ncbi:hypothetical protein DE146DRAFT_781431 [Phaeosphaeria sp. MPI-PUGE-AT-0046c]|nr:hypothetical protein DE146DRAFT_781431 [Phaeosphaeria sp. MPI-PUGE-AT-0046c]
MSSAPFRRWRNSAAVFEPAGRTLFEKDSTASDRSGPNDGCFGIAGKFHPAWSTTFEPHTKDQIEDHIFHRAQNTVGIQREHPLWHFQGRSIVIECMRKDLAYAKGMFPALQGLAKRGSAFLSGYIAGLWKTTLIHTLTWYQPLNASKLPRPHLWRARTSSASKHHVSKDIRSHRIRSQALNVMMTMTGAMAYTRTISCMSKACITSLRAKRYY